MVIKERKKRRSGKFLTALTLVLVMIAFLAFAAGGVTLSFAEENSAEGGAAAADPSRTTADSFLIGSWVSYYPYEIRSHEEQTKTMADAGLNFNIFPMIWSTGAAQKVDAEWWSYVDRVYGENNMVYLLDDFYTASVVRGGVDVEIASRTAQHAGWAKELENCIGYHLADEPTVSGFENIAKYARAMLQADPDRFAFVNLLPYPVDAGISYRDYIQGWLDAVGAGNTKYLSHDYYPITTGGIDSGIYAAMETMRDIAYNNGKLRTHGFLQSSQWTGKRMPTADEMRWNAYQYLAYGFKALSWFNLVTPGTDASGEGFTQSIIHRDGTVQDWDLYQAFSDLNWEIRGLGGALMNLDTAHAYHTIRNTAGVEYLPDDYPVRPIDGVDMILSEMEAKDGSETHIMLFNKSATASVNARFSVGYDSGIEGLQWLDPSTGTYIPVDMTDFNFSVSLRPGEGKLYKIVGSFGADEIAPVVSLASGKYSSPQTVTVTAPQDHTFSSIYYTLDGSYPTRNSPRLTGALKIGERNNVNKYTLRVAGEENGRLSEIVTREYYIVSLPSDYGLPISTYEDTSFTGAPQGAWNKSGGSITSGAAGEATYAYKEALGGCFVTEAMFRLTGEETGSAGFIVRSSEGADADALAVRITHRGVVSVEYNGVAAPSMANAAGFVRTNFTVRVIKLWDDVIVYVNDDELLTVRMEGAGFSENYVGVFTSGVPLQVSQWRANEFDNERVVVVQRLVQAATQKAVVVDKLTEKAAVIALLPERVTCFATGGLTASFAVTWRSDSYDRTAEGDHLFIGEILIPPDAAFINVNNITAQITVTVRYDLNFGMLAPLLAKLEKLDAAQYTEASWNRVQTQYDKITALMENRDQPQSVIFPLYTNLATALENLENPNISWEALDAEISRCEALNEEDYFPDSFSTFAAILSEVKALSRKGPVVQADADARTARLVLAQSYLIPYGNPRPLNALLTSAKQRRAEDYTTATFSRLQSVISDAETLLLIGGTQDEYDYMAENLRGAITSLKERTQPTEQEVPGESGCGSAIGPQSGIRAAVLLFAAVCGMLAVRGKGKTD